MLDSVRGGMGGAVATAVRIARIVSRIPGIRVTSALSSQDGRDLDDLIADYKAQQPIQGLRDAAGNPRQVGLAYLRLAN